MTEINAATEPRELDAHLHRVVYGDPVQWLHVRHLGFDIYEYDPQQEWDNPKGHCYPRGLGRWEVVPQYSADLREAFDLWREVCSRAPRIEQLVRETELDILAIRDSDAAARELCRVIAWAYNMAAMVTEDKVGLT